MSAAVEVSGLRVVYGDVAAVDGVSFTVPEGAVFGLVGPNGAGKTTTVECIEGLRRPQEGTVAILGMNPRRERGRVFQRVGVLLQGDAMHSRIRPPEALRLFASFYPTPIPPHTLLHAFALEGCAKTSYKDLSGGEKRALSTALALVGNPDLAILDEPTSGLDPHARRRCWEALRRHRTNGMTILLTTHNLQEAEEECDTVCVMDRGRIVALGPPRQLLAERQLGTRIHGPRGPLGEETFAHLRGVTRVEVTEERICLYGRGEEFLSSVTQTFLASGIRDVHVRPASLEDLYLILTGRDYPEQSG
jgi:ABC-2 type transport system ATP-binding protein